MNKISLALMIFATSCLPSATANTQTLPSDHLAVFELVIRHLENDYVDPVVGKSAAKTLSADTELRTQARSLSGPAFAEVLTEQVQLLTNDGHFNLEFSSDSIDLNSPVEESFGDAEMERYYGAHLNFGVQRAERLDNNIGYLDLRVFAPLEMGAETVVAALTMLAHTDALIIDLRNNGGGIGDMADLVASFMFDGGRHPLTGVYDRPKDTITQQFTQAYVPGRRFGSHKPAYVLTSSRTFSAAEALAYNLQALGRATIIGEVTGGGAHPFEYQPIHPHFVLWSVTAKSVNPITETNWQGVGVQPDIAVAAADALTTAIEHLSNSN